ncbi:MAG TPA: hypothetical protein VNE86_04140 [Nitrososphaerales archaeon]|nr:hypothetical protein [Nitrososphaerales archaeon]
MGFISDVLEQIKLGQYKSAAIILEENLQDPTLKPSAKIDIMEWIADCYSKAEEPGEASKWFENAARAILESPDIPQIERKRKAIKDIEKAVDCSKTPNDIERIKGLTKLKFSLGPNL